MGRTDAMTYALFYKLKSGARTIWTLSRQVATDDEVAEWVRDTERIIHSRSKDEELSIRMVGYKIVHLED